MEAGNQRDFRIVLVKHPIFGLMLMAIPTQSHEATVKGSDQKTVGTGK